MKKKTVLFFFGTRPEAIKFAPLIHRFKKSRVFNTLVCVSGQHREMLDPILNFFEITPDFDLNLMRYNQSILDLSSFILKELNAIFDLTQPDLLFVQGDTTTAFSGALAGFYKKIPVAHLEAGLRSHNRFSPYPEEVNRRLTDHLAEYHFAPTMRAQENLHREHIRENTWIVGNSVIDALHMGLEKIHQDASQIDPHFFSAFGLDFSKKIVLITCHRRESIGEPFEQICKAISTLSQSHPDIQFVFPVHLNPNIQKTAKLILSQKPNVFLLPTLNYPQFIYLLQQAYFVMTDSGGIQEEAPSLGKPLLILRETTERTEGIDAGTALLTGTSQETIVQVATQLLSDPTLFSSMSKAVNPYGNGKTSENILRILEAIFALPLQKAQNI